jgi:sialic acid synthase SpsE
MNTYIVAEIASNWEGSISKAKKLILESKKARVNAVKFQMWRTNDLYSKANPQWKIIKKSELTIKKTGEIKQH